MNKLLHITSLAAALTCAGLMLGSLAKAEAPQAVVTVRPLHSLVASIMDGIASPVLLLDGAQSPHSYSLSPSDAKALSDADLVIWVGEPLETFLERPLANLASSATVLELASDGLLTLRDNREGAVWETGAHDDDDHDHDHDHGHDHADHHKIDGHIWLDPDNARRIVDVTASAMAELDPENAVKYASNAVITKDKITATEESVRARLASYLDKPFLTSHDSLQYFDRYFGLEAAGAITATPDQAPSVRRVAELRDAVKKMGAVCVLSEPGYAPRVIQVVTEAAEANFGVVDPLGINLTPGPALYFDMMTGLADSLAACLGSNDG